MENIKDMLFIASLHWGTIFPEDKEKFKDALKKVGYILHQDEETGEFEIYTED